MHLKDKINQWFVNIMGMSLIVSAIIGCDKPQIQEVNQPIASTHIYVNGKWTYTIYNVEGCEYISFLGPGIAHKGNCTNAIHKVRYPIELAQ